MPQILRLQRDHRLKTIAPPAATITVAETCALGRELTIVTEVFLPGAVVRGAQEGTQIRPRPIKHIVFLCMSPTVRAVALLPPAAETAPRVQPLTHQNHREVRVETTVSAVRGYVVAESVFLPPQPPALLLAELTAHVRVGHVTFRVHVPILGVRATRHFVRCVVANLNVTRTVVQIRFAQTRRDVVRC